MSINTVVISGRAGRDPEVRYFESGKSVANFTIAVDRNSRDEEPDWFDVEIWGQSARTAADYVRKGSRVAIEGRLVQQRWTDRQSGQSRSKVVISGFRLDLIDTKAETEARKHRTAAAPMQQQQQGQTYPSSYPAKPAPQTQAWYSSGGSFDDSQVPF